MGTDLEASSFCGTNVITRMQFLERFALSMEYADLALFFDFDDPDDNEKRSLLKTFTLIGKEMFEDIKFNSMNRKTDSFEPCCENKRNTNFQLCTGIVHPKARYRRNS